MGKYHPHGDSSIYEALVVMEQDFKKGMPLVDGHGNFGSIEGDGAAAMRYTEAKLQKFTQDVYLADMDKNVVDFQPNFDETEKEPVVLPVRIPNLLINGAEGIAVGMTTSIPPHNLSEVVDGVKAYMDNPEITTEELMEYVKGPDFPTGGIVVNQKELKNIYETALQYGYSYESREEKYFILLLIRGAVSYGDTLCEIDGKVNEFIRNGILPEEYQDKEQIEQTAGALSKELLYMKFLQGIPVVGAVGGAYDAVYMKRITEYAELKYRHRYLAGRKKAENKLLF